MDNPNIRRWTRDLELLNHLALFELGLVVEPEVAHPAFAATTCAESPWKTVWLLLWRVVEAGPVVAALARHLDLEQPMSLNCAQESAVLEQAIGAEIGESMAEPVARDLGITTDDAQRRIVQLSQDIGLLPPPIVEVVNAHIPWALRIPLERLAQVVDDPGLFDRVRRENLAMARHFERVRKNGRSAEKRLIEAHRPLVVSLARKYVGRCVTYRELVDAGDKGLVRAVAKFDHRKGYGFPTYAAWWIRHAITKVVSGAEGTARVSVHEVQFINELMRHHRRLLGEKGREPTTEELAQAMGVTVEQVQEIQSIKAETGGPSDLERLQDIVRMDMAFDAYC